MAALNKCTETLNLSQTILWVTYTTLSSMWKESRSENVIHRLPISNISVVVIKMMLVCFNNYTLK